MPDELNPQPKNPIPKHVAEAFGNLPHGTESVGKVPYVSELHGTIPQSSESFRSVPQHSEPLPPSDWRESYTLTVREVARLFEAAGVARSERSIVNWCQKNRQGFARLGAYFDPNERRYFITRQSVDTIISEEKARAAKANAEPVPAHVEPVTASEDPNAESFRKAPTSSIRTKSESVNESSDLAELRKENFDLKITNRGKDYFIDQMKTEREGLLKQLVDSSQRLGQLETRLLQLNESAHQAASAEKNDTA